MRGVFMNSMVKKIILIAVIAVTLIILALGGLYAYKKYMTFYNSPNCNAGRPMEIAQYVYEVNQRDFPHAQYQSAKVRIKNPKTLKVINGNHYCTCDLEIKLKNGEKYIKHLYFLSANYSGNPMVMLQNQSFTEKPVHIK